MLNGQNVNFHFFHDIMLGILHTVVNFSLSLLYLSLVGQTNRASPPQKGKNVNFHFSHDTMYKGSSKLLGIFHFRFHICH